MARDAHLPYILKVGSVIVARFADERDALGFARARFRSGYEVIERTISDFDRIFQAIQSGIKTAPEVAQATHIDQRIVWTAFTKLKKQGRIRKIGVLPDPPYRVAYEVTPPVEMAS